MLNDVFNHVKSLFEHFEKPVFIMDSNSVVIWRNHAFEKLDNAFSHYDSVKRMIEGGHCSSSELLLEKVYINGYLFYIAIVVDAQANTHILELERAARTDGLTGLHNQLSFIQLLEKKLITAQKTNEHLVLVFADLDRFKPINDTYGHSAGDEVLKHFSQQLRNHTRSTDICARVGGDEFAMILSCEFDAATSIIKRIEEKPPFYYQGNLLDYGCSFGLVSADGFHTLESLLAQADTLMYDHKKHKRSSQKVQNTNRYLGLGRSMKIKMPFPLPLDFVLENVIDNIEHTEIKPSELHGFGLFAKYDMPKHKVLCKLTGQIMTKQSYTGLVERLTPYLEDLSFYFLMECNHVSNPRNLMVRAFRTKWSYVNHSTEPNCEFEIDTGILYAKREIKAGEELTFDYRVEPLDSTYLTTNKDWLDAQ
jgi:diguanylate cyclase (GGDEF)-like protein